LEGESTKSLKQFEVVTEEYGQLRVESLRFSVSLNVIFDGCLSFYRGDGLSLLLLQIFVAPVQCIYARMAIASDRLTLLF
jgi:hypothetical protein